MNWVFFKKHIKLINFACYWSPNFKKIKKLINYTFTFFFLISLYKYMINVQFLRNKWLTSINSFIVRRWNKYWWLLKRITFFYFSIYGVDQYNSIFIEFSIATCEFLLLPHVDVNAQIEVPVIDCFLSNHTAKHYWKIISEAKFLTAVPSRSFSTNR